MAMNSSKRKSYQIFYAKNICLISILLINNLLAHSICYLGTKSNSTLENLKKRVIPFGTALKPEEQILASKKLAEKIASPNSSEWRAKGDQKRFYHFSEAGADIPYRIYIPSNWDGKSKLPLVMFLHGGWNDESSYVDANDKQMLKLAEEHCYLLVSPLGCKAAYGNFLLLPAVFGKHEEAIKILSSIKSERVRAQELSEMDIINVLELVLNEYPVDRSRMFLTGHSMGSGGTWYLGAKYHSYWSALAPMSGPFVDEFLYPWDNIRRMPIFISEGTKATASLEGSRQMYQWMKSHEFNVIYKEVDADRPGMVPIMLPDVFDFFDKCYKK